VGSWLRTCAVLVALAAAACVHVAPAAPGNGPPLLAVVTWNLHGGEGNLPRLLDDLAAGELTTAPVRDYLLLLQEAIEGGRHDVRAIAGERMLAAAFSPVRRTGRGVSGNAILSTRPLDRVRVVDLPRERQPRAALAATLDLAGHPLFIVDTHLENRLGWRRGLFGDRARGRQADALLAAIPSPGHGILGGDMNTMLGADESALRAFFARFPDTPPDPEPTFRNRLVLDHLFFDLPDGWTATRRVLPERYGSDHHPVLGLIHLKN
jgi:endonuclease/exonuclease/phosphatase family metal-dependent hydrolase